MRQTSFYLEMLEGEKFEGYTDDQLWNGWASPYFTFEVGQQIVQAMKRFGAAFYDDTTDEFVFDENDGGAPEDYQRYGAVDVQGTGRLYPIGNAVWIWSEVETEAAAAL